MRKSKRRPSGVQEWPELVQASMLRSEEKHKAAIQQLRSNVGQWAEEVQESVPGDSFTCWRPFSLAETLALITINALWLSCFSPCFVGMPHRLANG